MKTILFLLFIVSGISVFAVKPQPTDKKATKETVKVKPYSWKPFYKMMPKRKGSLFNAYFCGMEWHRKLA